MYYCLWAWNSGSPWRMIAHKKVWEINRERRGSQGLFWHKVWSGGRTQQLVIKYLLVDSSSHLERKKGQGCSYRSKDRTWGQGQCSLGIEALNANLLARRFLHFTCSGKEKRNYLSLWNNGSRKQDGRKQEKNSECCFAIPLTDVSRARMCFHRWPDSFSAKKCG